MINSSTQIRTLVDGAIFTRLLPSGGFCWQVGGEYRPDATAWAIMALSVHYPQHPALAAGRARLAAAQLKDGRVPLSPLQPQTFWPTPLAVLAWTGTQENRAQQELALQFLLRTTGRHFPREPHGPYGHDPALRGWPWIEDTFSWVPPTAMAVLALAAAGYGEGERLQEAILFLMDRQLPCGGWNYGNTTMFGQTLRPMPETTGMALTALAGHVHREDVAASLTYLSDQLGQIRTPLSLGWGLLGLTAWGARPPWADRWLRECWQRQDRYGPYDTTALALLSLAGSTLEGLPISWRPAPRASACQ
jgi:hypothetical protein